MMIDRNIHYKSSGFGLIEVLISLVILSIGSLGIAGIQVVGMKNNHSAYLRGQAHLFAYDLTDIMRSNPSEVLANKFGSAADNGVDISSGNLGFDITANCTTTTGCTTEQMAETDLANWAVRINTVLPSGMATINRVGIVYTVTISWLDDRSDTDGTGVDVNGDGNTTNDLNISDDIDGDGTDDISITGNEVNFKQISVSFEP